MAILPTVGRKDPRVRLVIAAIYMALILGGITMVVPFCIMLTSSISNQADYERYDIFPAYFFREDLRFGKFLAEKYTEIRFEHFAVAHGAPAEWSTFKDLGFAGSLENQMADLKVKPMDQLQLISKDYGDFISGYDPGNMFPLFFRWGERGMQDFLRQKYQAKVQEKGNQSYSKKQLSEASLELLSRTWNEGIYLFWDFLNFKQEMQYPYHMRRWVPPNEPRERDYLEYVKLLPASKKLPITTHYLWCLYLLDNGVQISKIDEEYKTHYESIYKTPTGEVADLPAPLAALWQKFLAEAWPVRLIEIAPDAAAGFQSYLRTKYKTVDALNADAIAKFKSFEEIPSSVRLPEDETLRRVWVEYVLTVPAEQQTRLSAEGAYRAFLKARYPDAALLNKAYGWNLASVDKAELPLREIDYLDYITNKKQSIFLFLTHNFVQIINFIAGRGSSLYNTFILVTLTIIFTLTINPMAAYALSRFRLRLTQQILVYLLATMAFPPEVGMIPGFLLLRDLHLLNTFPALILPGVANGFTIFLLKGFFDSLPKELYEAASIDGASEVRMFTTITLPLCMPILAVIALNAFIAAYGSFMWAFLVCQDSEKWTLMVWLYQFQSQYASQPHLIMAAIVLTSIPTLIVFVFCQKIILRGIVIPSMK